MATTTNVIKSGLTINEVLYQANIDTDGDGTTSVTGDEFIEISNVSGSSISLANVEIWEDQLVHQFGSGETLAAGETYLILRQTANLTTAQAKYPGAKIALASNSMNLTNGGEAIALVDTGSGDYVQWLINNTTDLPSGETGFPGTNLVGTDTPALASSIDNSIARTPGGDATIASSTPSPTLFCFAEGTEIATTTGGKAVETLSIGDLILTVDSRSVPVKWVGRQTLNKFRHGPKSQPVRIRARALGNGLPHTDLTVTADHGMIIDDLVINAAALINGTTIDFVPLAELEDQFTVYHIETEDHDVILANGAASETFVDAITRSHFDNFDEYLALYGAERIIMEMNRPRIASQRLVPQAIKDRLAGSQGEVPKASTAA